LRVDYFFEAIFAASRSTAAEVFTSGFAGVASAVPLLAQQALPSFDSADVLPSQAAFSLAEAVPFASLLQHDLSAEALSVQAAFVSAEAEAFPSLLQHALSVVALSVQAALVSAAALSHDAFSAFSTLAFVLAEPVHWAIDADAPNTKRPKIITSCFITIRFKEV